MGMRTSMRRSRLDAEPALMVNRMFGATEGPRTLAFFDQLLGKETMGAQESAEVIVRNGHALRSGDNS